MSHTYCGAAFGISFASNQPLPEFQGCGDALSAPAEVTIEWHPPRAQGPMAGPKPFRLNADVFELAIPGICDFRVSQQRIDVHPVPGVAPETIRAYLSGSAIGALLHLRRMLVFHGSAVCLPDGTAAVFCGLSTAGKSTLAATLAQQGHPALADDLCAVEPSAGGQSWCLPGLARTKLWRDALERLGLDGQAGPDTQVMPDLDKHALPLKTSHQAAALTRFYQLHVDETSQIPLTMTPLMGMDKITVLLSQIYRPGYLQAMGRQNQMLAAVAGLAPQLQMFRITRPRQGDTLPAIVAWLHDQWRVGA